MDAQGVDPSGSKQTLHMSYCMVYCIQLSLDDYMKTDRRTFDPHALLVKGGGGGGGGGGGQVGVEERSLATSGSQSCVSSSTRPDTHQLSVPDYI